MKTEKKNQSKSKSGGLCNTRRRPSPVYEMLHYSVYLLRLQNKSYDTHIRTAFFTNKNRGVIIIAINFDEYEDLDVELYKFHLVWQIKDIIVR